MRKWSVGEKLVITSRIVSDLWTAYRLWNDIMWSDPCVVLFTGWFHRCIVLMWALMHRTFNQMNGIKQHLGESYHVRFVYVTRYRPICAIDRSRCAIYGSVVGANIDRSCSHRWIALRYRWMNTGQCFQVSGLGERSFWALGIVNVVEYWTYGHCHRIVEHL